MGAPKGHGKGTTGDKGKSRGKGTGVMTAGNASKVALAKGKGKTAAKSEPKWVKVKGTVLVTGASGFVAMSIIRRLLDKHYKVKGTVRSLESQSAKDLKELFPKLVLYEADLLGSQEAFEKAMVGCNFVMHTASPLKFDLKDLQKEMLEPSVQGTEKVVSAAIKMGISRVVVTSSTAAVGPPQTWFIDSKNCVEGKVFDESDWTEGSSLESAPYPFSKLMAEKKAWELAEGKEGFSVACINPAMIIGPMLSSRADGESVKFIKSMLEGTATLSGFPLGVVDVRDVASAHVAAMENPEAGGKRFCITSEEGHHKLKMADMLRDHFKAYPVPQEGELFGYTPKFSIARAKEILKFKPRPVEISLRDMANAAIRAGIVEKRFGKSARL